MNEYIFIKKSNLDSEIVNHIYEHYMILEFVNTVESEDASSLIDFELVGELNYNSVITFTLYTHNKHILEEFSRFINSSKNFNTQFIDKSIKEVEMEDSIELQNIDPETFIKHFKQIDGIPFVAMPELKLDSVKASSDEVNLSHLEKKYPELHIKLKAPTATDAQRALYRWVMPSVLNVFRHYLHMHSFGYDFLEYVQEISNSISESLVIAVTEETPEKLKQCADKAIRIAKHNPKKIELYSKALVSSPLFNHYFVGGLWDSKALYGRDALNEIISEEVVSKLLDKLEVEITKP